MVNWKPHASISAYSTGIILAGRRDGSGIISLVGESGVSVNSDGTSAEGRRLSNRPLSSQLSLSFVVVLEVAGGGERVIVEFVLDLVADLSG